MSAMGKTLETAGAYNRKRIVYQPARPRSPCVSPPRPPIIPTTAYCPPLRTKGSPRMTRTRTGLALAAALFTLAAGRAAQPQATDPTLEPLRKDIFFLAGPECEGRGIDTKGINKAADYVAESFRAAGLRPATPDNSFFQPFKVTL